MASISVACKLPNGIVINHAGITKEIMGANDARAVAGFGITPGIDGDWFKSWADTDAKDLPAVQNGMIFAMAPAKIEDAAEERADDASVQTGLEAIDPNKPGLGVEPTDAQKAENAKLAS